VPRGFDWTAPEERERWRWIAHGAGPAAILALAALVRFARSSKPRRELARADAGARGERGA
jgi:hypothetical protein